MKQSVNLKTISKSFAGK